MGKKGEIGKVGHTWREEEKESEREGGRIPLIRTNGSVTGLVAFICSQWTTQPGTHTLTYVPRHTQTHFVHGIQYSVIKKKKNSQVFED